MKIPLIKWATPAPTSGQFLLTLPYDEMVSVGAKLDELPVRPYGLIPPFAGDHSFNFRSMAVTRDFFPNHNIYAPVVILDEPREIIRAARSAQFRHFVLPYYEPFPHLWQEVHDLLRDREVHVAGGDPGVEGLTWSEEGLV